MINKVEVRFDGVEVRFDGIFHKNRIVQNYLKKGETDLKKHPDWESNPDSRI